MEKVKSILGLVLVIVLCGCGVKTNDQQQSDVSYEAQEEELALTAAAPNALVSSSAAVVNPKDTTRKFIRTADLKFKVKNVIQSTYDIENITSRQGGFVTSTELTSDISHTTETAVSADSTLAATYYTVTNSMTIRVPNAKLDTTLKEIARNIDFLDYRTIKAQDVALNILANDLTQKRLKKNEGRLIDAIDNRGKKLNETANAEELLLNKQEEADNAKVSNMSLADQINFSTINLLIYQRQDVKYELVSNNKDIDAYTPSFGSKLLDSLRFGWDILDEFLNFLVKSWGIVLFAVIVYFFYKIYRRKFK